MNTNYEKPDIFEYDNYRLYLKKLYAFLKSEKKHFSYRYFSKIAGFKSTNFLKLVIDGDRNLSPESIEKFAKALQLKGKEKSFFRNLVLLEQSETIEEKKYFAEQLVKSKSYKKVNPLGKAEYGYYANWYHIPIRELVNTKDFKEDPDWIAKKLSPEISEKEAEKALEELLKLGLIERNKDGKLQATDESISTGNEVSEMTSTSIRAFHKNMANLGIEAMARHSYEDRDISSLTLGLSKQGICEVKELVQKFRKELLAIASQEKNKEDVYQLNFQFFPLTTAGDKKGDKK